MRSIKEAYTIKKHNLVIGNWYGILLLLDENNPREWIFRFAGLDERHNCIMSDITYFNEDGFGWNYTGSNIGMLCDDSEWVKGSIRKYSESDVKEIINLQ